jgi:hypothetical protein
MIKATIALLALTGCSSLDDEVGIAVTGTITVQPSEPDSLATVQLDVVMSALSRADHELALDHVTIGDTELAMAPFTPFYIHANESADRSLANAGTTNAELAGLCGQTATVTVFLSYLDGGDGTFASTPVAIACL